MGSLAASSVETAAAELLSDADLAYARMLVGAELLAVDFYQRAIASKRFDGDGLKHLTRALFNEQEHLASVSEILTGAGQVPAVAADIDFAYPKGTFASRGSTAKLGVVLETAFVGAYLGAVGAIQSNPLKQSLARVAASEAQHLSIFTGLTGGNPVGISFPEPLSIEQASDALDAFTS